MTAQAEEVAAVSPSEGSVAAMFRWIQYTIDEHELVEATAQALRTASTKVLDVVPDHSVQIEALDVQDVVRKFHIKHRGTMKEATVNTYEQRFRQTVEMYTKWLAKDDSWRPATRNRSTAPKKAGSQKPDDKVQATLPAEQQPPTPPLPGMINYPFPIRPGMQGKITLPEDLTMREAKRIAAFVSTLAFDDEPEPMRALPAGQWNHGDPEG